MAYDYDFKKESYLEYYGDEVQVKKIINKCKYCGSSLVFAHSCDFKNLTMRESADCPSCEGDTRKTVHPIN